MDGVIETGQFLIVTLLIIMSYRMVYQGQEDLDCPSTFLVVYIRYFVGSVCKAEVDANHPSKEVRVACGIYGGWFP